MQWLVRLLVVWVALTWGASSASAQESYSCETPRSAAASLLNNLMPDNWHPEAATMCVSLPPERADSAQRLAIQLKQVLDARALYIPVDDLPDDPDYTNAKGEQSLIPLDDFPVVVIVKEDDRWVYSRSTMQAVPRLYQKTFSSVMLALQKQMPPMFFQSLFGLFLWQYIYFVLLVAASLFVGWLAQLLLAQQVIQLASRLELKVDLTLIRRVRSPLTWFVTGLVFNWGIPDLQFGVQGSLFLKFIAVGTMSISAVLMISRVVDLTADLFAKRAENTDSKLDDQVIPLVSRALKVALWVLGIVFTLQNVGVEVTALLAGVSVGGVAVALAAQDTISNLFGSLTIFTDRPFQIGDWVIIGGDIEGVVEEVGFRSTRIRTFGKSIISVPNAKVANQTVNNMGQRPYRRLKLNFGISYTTPPATVREFLNRVEAVFRANPYVWQGTLEVRFVNFGDSSLDIMVYTFLDVPGWTEELTQKQELLLKIMEIAQDLEISFAFPSTSVYFETPIPSA